MGEERGKGDKLRKRGSEEEGEERGRGEKVGKRGWEREEGGRRWGSGGRRKKGRKRRGR